MYPDLDVMLDLLTVDHDRIELGRRRQAAIWRGDTPDRVPILLGRSESRQVADRVGPQHLRLCEHQLRGGEPVPEYHRFDHYTLREQFEDPRRMLIESLWDIIGWARTPSDAQLSLRPNYGVGIVASVFGCSIDIGENDMPWVASRPDRSRLFDLDLDRLDRQGLMPRVIEFIELTRDALRDFSDVHVFLPDLQGPLNTAFLLRQQDVFFDMIDEPAEYHRLLELITEVFIRLTKRLKTAVGEPLDGGYHGAMYMENGGARVVDDVSIMISPSQYQEFSLPYVRRCLEPFGGGWVHSCGDISHQIHFYLDAPEIKGVNLGQPEYYDFDLLLPRFAEQHTFCYGGPVRSPGESTPHYLARVARSVRTAPNTLIFIPRDEGLEMSEGRWPSPDETLALWERTCREN